MEIKNYTFAGISKKVFTYFVDLLIVFVLALILNISCVPILENTPQYKNASKIVEDKVAQIYSFEEEANLIDFISLDGTKKDIPLDRNEMFTKYIYRNIALSYVNDSNGDFKNNNVVIDEFKYGILTSDNDYLSYFYIKFIPNLGDDSFVDYNKKPIDYYVNDVLKKYIKNQNAFIVDGDLPYLNSEFGYSLYRYVIKNETDYQAGKENYDTLANYFNDAMNNSLNLFQDYKPFKESYSVYLSNYESLINSSILYQFIIYTISFVILLIVVPLFSKNRSLGSIIMKTTLFDLKEQKIKWYMLLSKKMVDFVSMYWINLVISIFTIGMIGVAKSVFSIGGLNISMFVFIFISMIFATISVTIGISREDKRCLSELVSNTIYLIEEKDHVATYQEKINKLKESKTENND